MLLAITRKVITRKDIPMIPLEQTRESIRNFIFQQFPGTRGSNLTDDDSLLTSGAIDSMGILELVTFIESSFDVHITDDEMLSNNFESITSLSTFVTMKNSSGISTTSGE
jgi:acyl carrier protein